MVVTAMLLLLVQDLSLAADGGRFDSWNVTRDNRFGISQRFFNTRNDFGGGYLVHNGTFVPDASLVATAGRARRFWPGPGYGGGHVAAAVAMMIHHRYLQYRALVSSNITSTGLLGKADPITGVAVVTHLPCAGGCPAGSFCDYGLCRCLEGFQAWFGECFQNFAIAFAKSRKQMLARLSSSFVPFRACADHTDCAAVDINMVCQQEVGVCGCRSNLRWNRHAGECQLFLDVDCTQPGRGRRSPLEGHLDYNSLDNDYDSLDYGEGGDYYSEDGLFGPDSEMGDLMMFPPLNGDNLPPESDGLPANLSHISAAHTLAASRLSRMSPETSPPQEVAWQFCTEVAILVEANESKNRFFRGDAEDRTKLPDGYVLDSADDSFEFWRTIGACAFGVALVALLMLAGACAGCGVKKWKADDEDDDIDDENGDVVIDRGDVEQNAQV